MSKQEIDEFLEDIDATAKIADGVRHSKAFLVAYCDSEGKWYPKFMGETDELVWVCNKLLKSLLEDE